MSCVIVPNHLSEAIYKMVDAEIAKVPAAAADREALYQTVLNYYDMHGALPEIELKRHDDIRGKHQMSESCKAYSWAYGGGATCEQRWACPECGDVTETTECPKGRKNETLEKLAASDGDGESS